MKYILYLGLIISLIIISCTQKKAVPETKIENSLKSVSFWYDSVGIDPHLLFLSVDRVNKVIDSIGYPDAGYIVWLVQSDTNKAYRFMMEGYWPNQAIYDTIHNNVLYKNANKAATSKEEEEMWKALKGVDYNRFTLVK
jgi:hypothetical protein